MVNLYCSKPQGNYKLYIIQSFPCVFYHRNLVKLEYDNKCNIWFSMAIYSDNDHGSIFQIKNYLCANSDTTAPSMHTCTQHRNLGTLPN